MALMEQRVKELQRQRKELRIQVRLQTSWEFWPQLLGNPRKARLPVLSNCGSPAPSSLRIQEFRFTGPSFRPRCPSPQPPPTQTQASGSQSLYSLRRWRWR